MIEKNNKNKEKKINNRKVNNKVESKKKKKLEDMDPEERRAAVIKKMKKRRKRTRVYNKLTKAAIVCLVLGVASYLFIVFSSIPVIAKWRTVYIETAMSTMTHQWMAELLFPGYMIDEVVAKSEEGLEAQENLISQWSSSIEAGDSQAFLNEEDKFYYAYPELNCDSFKNYLEQHPELVENDDYSNILIENLDHNLGLMTAEGDNLLVVDTANNLVLVGLEGNGYYGKLAIVKDSSQIDLAISDSYGTFGQEVETIAENNDALIAINASRFQDIGGHGNGGTVKGSMVKNKEELGNPKRSFWKFAGIQDDGHLYIESYHRRIVKNYNWGVEVYPALIVNGQNVIDGSLGMGIQPRTAIGQKANGDFLLLAVDGRQVGYSLGCDVEECATILSRYEAVQGMNLDGGSSTVMIYKGEMISKPCSVSGRGRYVPDAIIAKKASNSSQ